MTLLSTAKSIVVRKTRPAFNDKAAPELGNALQTSTKQPLKHFSTMASAIGMIPAKPTRHAYSPITKVPCTLPCPQNQAIRTMAIRGGAAPGTTELPEPSSKN
jgi:hypothetical protein